MRKWDTVAIVGVGLIGGSIGLALQQRGLARRIVGIGRRESSLRKARQARTVTQTTTKLERGVADAELVIVCTPVGEIVERVCTVARALPACRADYRRGEHQSSDRPGTGSTTARQSPVCG